ncbi:hypothetical protein LTR86_000163 [Recurvomyces mirabilis]|nr:hypothetical protein LTR86_000163 [Recurvomyces mirabilis]
MIENFWLFLPLLLLAIITHIGTLTLLANKRRALPPYRKDVKQSTMDDDHDTSMITDFGVLSAIVTLAVPFTVYDAAPLNQAALRAVCFFYACKILDLSLTKRDQPPTRLIRNGTSLQPAPMTTTWNLIIYAYYLLTEMRYHSFDIAVTQKGRAKVHAKPFWYKLLWTIGPLFLLPTATYYLPVPGLKAACLLLLIQHALELVHKSLHYGHSEPEFLLPFSAATLAEFWGTHWQGAASPFLQSLAHRPVRKFGGSRAQAILAVFCLTGIWHGWAAAPLCTRPWLLGVEVWLLFVGFGAGILAEKWVWRGRQGGVVQRVCVWTYALTLAGVCWRTLELSSKIGIIRSA